MEVTSEILPYFERDSNSRPKLSEHNLISKFTFSCPVHENGKIEVDDDGDYVVDRLTALPEKTITLEHSSSTELSLVGLQIWRGALLLADFVIHFKELFYGKTVLELGTGVGLTSIVSAIFADTVISTDIDLGNILNLIRVNLKTNQSIIRANTKVFGLDFFDNKWSDELEKELRNVSVVLAADVVYDNDVTEAFIRTITKILNTPPKKSLFIALEKRYVFTIGDLDSVAPCYEHLLTCIEEAKLSEPWSGWTMQQQPIDFPQYFNYERVKQLVLWKISS